MKVDDMDARLRAWARSRGALPAPNALRQLVIDIPFDEPTTGGDWLGGLRSRRVRSILSATRLAAAGAIVALFGGFLIMGFLTTPKQDSLPTAVSASPSPTDPLAQFTTEVLEPGVLRVDAAVARDLLGASLYRPTAAIDRDNVFWRLNGRHIEAYDGERWTNRLVAPDRNSFRAMAISAEGTVWATAVDMSLCESDQDAEDCLAGTTLIRLDGSDVTSTRGWTDIETGPVSADRLVVTADGDVWLEVVREELLDYDNKGTTRYLRFDGSEWQRVELPAWTRKQTKLGDPMLASDGTIWATVLQGNELGEMLARHDGSGWTVYGADDGVREWFPQWPFWGGAGLKIAPDGAAWMSPLSDDGLGETCDGAVRFDGERWYTFLPGRCVFAFVFAPDGHVWLRTGEHVHESSPFDASVGEIHVVRPDAYRSAD